MRIRGFTCGQSPDRVLEPFHEQNKPQSGVLSVELVFSSFFLIFNQFPSAHHLRVPST